MSDSLRNPHRDDAAFIVGLEMARNAGRISETFYERVVEIVNENKQLRAAFPVLEAPPAPLDAETLAWAMQEAWNEFCNDTGNHPECVYRVQNGIWANFYTGSFAASVAALLAAHSGPVLGAPPNPQPEGSLVERMAVFAAEIKAEMECTTPAYGAPGHAHCAACCYGTGWNTTSPEDQLIVDAYEALIEAVRAFNSSSLPALRVTPEEPQ